MPDNKQLQHQQEKISMVHCTMVKPGDLVVLRKAQAHDLYVGIVNKVEQKTLPKKFGFSLVNIHILVPEELDMSRFFSPFFKDSSKIRDLDGRTVLQRTFQHVNTISKEEKLSRFEYAYSLLRDEMKFFVECYHVEEEKKD